MRPLRIPVPGGGTVRIVAFLAYDVPFNGMSIVGHVVVRTPLNRTYTDGFISGVVTRGFHLEANRTEVTAGLNTRVNLRLTLADLHLEARWQGGGGLWSYGRRSLHGSVHDDVADPLVGKDCEGPFKLVACATDEGREIQAG